MRIESAIIQGLLGREGPVSCSFRSDLTILTGRNGAGKTTVLKLIWYILSGNTHLALSEIDFRSISLVTSEYKIELTKISSVTCKGQFESDDRIVEFEDIRDDDDDVIIDARDTANSAVLRHGGSIFFPTFRRIEGGFSLQSSKRQASPNIFQSRFQMQGRVKNEVETGLLNLASSLSNRNHTFVSSISSSDIEKLLLENYSNLSQHVSRHQQDSYSKIISEIAQSKDSRGAFSDPAGLLNQVSNSIESIQEYSKRAMQPWNALSALVEKVFTNHSIGIGAHVNLGDAAKAMNSESLSAGEKQMLSFVSYNAFVSDSIIFIDEPELSLHIDWQRQLFPILLGQGTNNQYVICTHSPFIYSKYPDNEIVLNSDRGNTNESVYYDGK